MLRELVAFEFLAVWSSTIDGGLERDKTLVTAEKAGAAACNRCKHIPGLLWFWLELKTQHLTCALWFWLGLKTRHLTCAL